MKPDAREWAPYEPSPDNPWDLPKVAHLHRRAGFGATWSELQRDLHAGPAASIERLLHPDPEDAKFQQVAAALLRACESGRESFDMSGGDRAAQVWWLYRMVYGGDPLGEKLTLFWHNHFATALHGVYSLQLMLDQNAILRRHARGRFGDLLAAVESDRAMLVWLDGGSNQKDHPNENFARELLELFTLSPGHYTERDVRAAARGLTGWRPGRDSLFNRTNEFSYEDDLSDATVKTFLGETGAWRRPDILRIVLEQPAAARHLCRRLYRAFVSESADASDELIEPLASELRASNYSIEHVVGVMLRSRHFFSPAAHRRRVKSPVEFCVGMIRQLEPQRTPGLLPLAALSCERQGQILFDPPSVRGWDGGRAWLDSNGTPVRLNWVAELLTGNRTANVAPFNPRNWLKHYAVEPNKAVDTFAMLLLQNEINATTRSLAANQADLSSVLQVLLQTPEYQLA